MKWPLLSTSRAPLPFDHILENNDLIGTDV